MIDKKIKDCTGCNACFSICPKQCISMKIDGEGFRYPEVNYDLCIQCGLCIKICPILNQKKVNNKPIAYACINKEEKIRVESSSGGIFSLLADYVFDYSGVVVGAIFNSEFFVIHECIEDRNDLSKLRGSKYLQSDIKDVLIKTKKFLDQNRLVLFSGTPCQIGGLKSFLEKEYENLICIDIVCHGVPSPKVWGKYLEFRKTKANSDIERISFRTKNLGWKRYSVLFQFKNNTEYLKPLTEDLYMQAFLRDVCLRPSCYDCKFKTLNRESDITLADFWGIQNLLPNFDDDKGTSLIFVNSEMGMKLFEKIKNKVKFQEVNIKEAVVYNSAAIKSVECNKSREEFFQKLDIISFDVLVKKYCKENIIFKVIKKIKTKLKRRLL